MDCCTRAAVAVLTRAAAATVLVCLPNSPVLTRIVASYVRLDATGAGIPSFREVGLLRCER